MKEEKKFIERLGTLVGTESVRSFAAKVGTSETNIRKYLRGGGLPTFGILTKIAKATGVSVSWLIGETEEMYIVPQIGSALANGPKIGEALAGGPKIGATLKKGIEEGYPADQEGIHPALVVLNDYLRELREEDRLLWADYLNHLIDNLPDFEEWVKKRRGGDRESISA